ncbi:hypothetical protein MASR1M32_19220 [Rhodobacter sp.]
MLPARSLAYFLATLQTASLTATARRFGVSVPTVSSSIARLEAQLGHPLFLRTPRGLVASEAAVGAAGQIAEILSGLTEFETGAAAGVPPDLDLHRCHDLRLSLRLITRFAAVFEAGSIGNAAAALRVTQPQISRQIAELETLLETPLFDRHSYGVTATQAAQRLYARARPLCDAAEALVRHGNRRFSADLNTTKLGSVPPFHPESRLAGLLCTLCIRWPARHPGASLAITTEATDGLVAALMAGTLHAAIVETDEVPEGCASRMLFRSELELLVGTAAPDASAETILTTCPCPAKPCLRPAAADRRLAAPPRSGASLPAGSRFHACHRQAGRTIGPLLGHPARRLSGGRPHHPDPAPARGADLLAKPDLAPRHGGHPAGAPPAGSGRSGAESLTACRLVHSAWLRPGRQG